MTLVSASPRRKDLLEQLNFPFDIAPSHAHERWVGGTAEGIAILNAERKVFASEHFGKCNRILLGADTIVKVGGRVFGKPAGIESARRMLEALSGWRHEVITAFCLTSFTSDGSTAQTWSEAVVSKVLFQELTVKTISAYLESNEWRGKAGAYAIQGVAQKFVAEVTGDYDNIVGLPVSFIGERLGTVFSDYSLL